MLSSHQDEDDGGAKPARSASHGDEDCDSVAVVAVAALRCEVVALRAEVAALRDALAVATTQSMQYASAFAEERLPGGFDGAHGATPGASALPGQDRPDPAGSVPSRVSSRASAKHLHPLPDHQALHSLEYKAPMRRQSIPKKENASLALADKSHGNEDTPLEFSCQPPLLLTDGQQNTLKYRAWTDIVRVRHPNFQRVSPAMSKAARYFREEHNLQLVRLVAQTSLKSNVTLAIPQHMQHKFLNYMEDLFYQPSTGIFGDGVPGAMQNVRNSNNGKNANPTLHPSGKDKDAAIPPLAPVSHSVDQRALTTFPIESPGASRKRVAVLDLAASELNQSVVSRTSPHRSGGLVGAVPERTLKRAKSMQEHTQGSAPDEDVFLEEGSGRGNYHGKTLASGNAKEPSTVIPSSYSGSYLAHAIVYSKNGVKMIRYGAILQRLMKDFKSLPKEARVAIKKGVKQFLMHEMMDQFDDCLIEEGDKVLTFGVPETLLQDFKGWAVEELARCFPQCEVIDRAL